MTNNSEEEEEEEEGQQKPRLYIIHLDGCNHTRVVNAQYLHDTVHRLAGESFYICDKCETGELRRVADITELP
jgi:hypothetical protein